TDMTVAELREEVDVQSREALRDEFVADALDAYADKEEALGAELMRDVERYIMLAVVDQRWREHLESMDYMREGVHLRAFAQKDPLVEYRAEGHKMFEELGQTIREEVVLTLFHAEVSVEPEALQQQPQDGNGNLRYQHETAAGAEAISGAATAGGATAVAGASATTALAAPQPSTNEHRDIGRNDPCWCGSGKKYKRCHG